MTFWDETVLSEMETFLSVFLWPENSWPVNEQRAGWESWRRH